MNPLCPLSKLWRSMSIVTYIVEFAIEVFIGKVFCTTERARKQIRESVTTDVSVLTPQSFFKMKMETELSFAS
jgi:hypothetical protein